MATHQFKQLRRSYGFDEVAIVPGDITTNPDQTNIDFKVEDFTFSIPIIASAMDAVTDVNFATLISQLGGLLFLIWKEYRLGMIILRRYWLRLLKYLMLKSPLCSKKSIPNRLKKILLANE